MKKFIFTLTCIFFTASGSFAQRSESEIALKEYFADAEFFLTQEYYVDALSDFLQVYRRGFQENANINYRIGVCYLNIPGQKQKSIEYFEKAKASVSSKYRESSLKEENAPIDVYLYLGNAYRVNDKLDEAILAYNEYKKLLPDDEKNLLEYVNQQIEACNIASEFMNSPVDVEFINMGPGINMSNENYKAVVSGDGSTLVYMHKLPFYDAVYFSKKVNDNWSDPENITPQIMSDGNQFVSSISYEGKMLLLSKEDEFNSDIYVSLYVDNRWTKSMPLGSNINTRYWESHASISKDGKTLYFTSNRKGGHGYMDIYVSQLNEEGVWGPPKNLGSEINTELNEDTPFITENGQSLYFSSQGFTSMGGYDVFKSDIKDSSEWSIPQNLGYPINTTDDDLFYFPWNNGEIAYMAKIRDEGFGITDIYKLVYPTVIDESVTQQEKDVVEEQALLVVDDTTVGEEQALLVVDDTTVGEMEAAVIPVVRTFTISPILFGFDKSTVPENSKIDLNNLVELLKSNSNLKVELLGYTDPLGPDDYNIKLARKRALTVMNILIGNGIAVDRLQAIGKGEVDFIAINKNADGSDSSEGRKYNRRVEFEILGVDNNVLIIKRIDPVPDHLKMP